MSTCKKEGKDVIIFATAEDHKEPSTVVLPEPDPQPGLILPNGEINWNCPCLGGMASGPCGLEFREAFSCFHNSEAEPKGRDCYEAFKQMHLCMAEYPQLYGNDEDEVENLAEVSEKSEVSLVNNSSKIESTDKEIPSNVSKAKVDDRPKADIRTEPKKSAKEPINSNFSNVNAQ